MTSSNFRTTQKNENKLYTKVCNTLGRRVHVASAAIQKFHIFAFEHPYFRPCIYYRSVTWLDKRQYKNRRLVVRTSDVDGQKRGSVM